MNQWKGAFENKEAKKTEYTLVCTATRLRLV